MLTATRDEARTIYSTQQLVSRPLYQPGGQPSCDWTVDLSADQDLARRDGLDEVWEGVRNGS